MPFKIIRNDITKVIVDAIVNSANHTPPNKKPFGADGAIHEAAGVDELLNARQAIGDINFGEAQITPAFALPAKIIIHTVAPILKINPNEVELRQVKEQLKSCYKNSLNLAFAYKCKSVACPILAAGINAFPKPDALKIAVTEIIDFLFEHDMTIFIVVFDREIFELAKKIFPNVESFIAEHEFETAHNREYNGNLPNLQERQKSQSYFRDYLFEQQRKTGLSDSQLYKNAHSSARVFSDIRHKANYSPRKRTAIGYALALKLSLGETQILLSRAGHNLSDTDEFDKVIIDCLNQGIYDVQTVNEKLQEKNQRTIG